MLNPTLLILTLLFVGSSASVHDFCVADLEQSDTPYGFPCKNVNDVTANDFTFSDLGVPGNTTNPIKAVITPAFTQQFPGVNGLWTSMARLDMAEGGKIPMHTHPGGTKILYLVKGTVCVAFMSYANKVYTMTLKKGDTFVIPQGLLHCMKICGTRYVFGITGFSSSNPGLQITTSAPFGNELQNDLVVASASLDAAQFQKLKSVLGGS